MPKMRALTLPAILLVTLVILACGGETRTSTADAGAVAVGAPALEEVVVREVSVEAEREVIREVVAEKAVAPSRAAAATPASSRAAAATPAPSRAAAATPAPSALVERSDGSTEEDVALVAQQRIIVRTVDLQVEVDDVPESLDRIAALADELGGWLVSSDRSRNHAGSAAIRVPADRLDTAISRIRAMAVEVTSEVLNSRDVTDEYVDLTARLKNLEATETALLRLMERAEKVEDALEVQIELTRVQEDVERLQGRIKFLEQTSAFSLINVFMVLARVDMPVDAGADQTFSVGQVARFQATFEPPEDIEEFTFTWDFGDGSPPIRGNRTAPTLEEGKRITAVVSHVYADDRTSPFIVEVEINGFGDAGVAEGEDKLIATVTMLPTIEVFAGDTRIAKEGEKLEFDGSFTRPEGLTDLTFRWDFGDGSMPTTGSLEEGVTTAVATHEYSDHRPFAYTATLTIIAQTEAGEVEASASVQVLITEARGWTVSGWSPGEQWKTAVRTLSGVGQGVGTFLIWLAIFSPLWLGGGAVAVLVFRRSRRGRRSDA